MDAKEEYRRWKAIYKLLDHVSLEVFDCGSLCGSACCMAQGNTQEMGIYLFPGEHVYLQEASWNSGLFSWEKQDPAEAGFPASWKEVWFVKCLLAPDCPRQLRPLQCRTFPLKPVFGDSGVLELIWNDEELPYTCPVIAQNMPIHDDFYKATYTVWSHLLKDRRIFDLVMMWSQEGVF